ncbi:MAG: PH domain-containing protein [Chitinophagaceae bacterium]
MLFQNIQVSWDSIPQIQTLQLQKIQPAYLKVLRISWSIVFAIFAIIITTCFLFIKEMQSMLWIVIAVTSYILVLVATFTIVTISFNTKAYAIREKDIVYRTGYIFQDFHIIPLNRIQHCVVESGPIERRYKLASLSLYTAAVGINDITIHGLLQTEAEQLREWILQQKQFSISQDDGL